MLSGGRKQKKHRVTLIIRGLTQNLSDWRAYNLRYYSLSTVPETPVCTKDEAASSLHLHDIFFSIFWQHFKNLILGFFLFCFVLAVTGNWRYTTSSKEVPWSFPGGSVVKKLPVMQETQVQSLIRKDPTCHGAAKPVTMRHNYWACALEPSYWSRCTQSLCPTTREAIAVGSPSPQLEWTRPATARQKPAQPWRPSTAKSR